MVAQKDLEGIRDYLQSTRKELRLPGLAVVIVEGDRLVRGYEFGTADKEDTLVTSFTPFQLGSLSKSFTALAVMQLVEREVLHLDDPIQAYLPWFRVADTEASSRITVRHLMTHSSGLSRYEGRALLSGRKSRSLEASVRSLCTVKLRHAPGEHFEYSNTNYSILGLLIEVGSHESYSSYMKQHVFEPLGMHASFTSLQEAEAAGLAQGYRWVFGIPVPFRAPYLLDAVPAAFIISTAHDMSHWLRLHLNGGALDGVQLLSSQGIDLLHTPQVPTKKTGSFAAMGWRVEAFAGTWLLRHGGEVANYRADMILLPERNLGVVTLQSCNNGLAALLGLDQIALNVVRLLLGQPPQKKALRLSRFFGVLALGAFVLTLLLVVVIPFIAFSGGPGLVAYVLLAVGVLWSLLVLWRVPRMADMPWKGLLLYVPDLSFWLLSMALVSLLEVLFLFVRFMVA